MYDRLFRAGAPAFPLPRKRALLFVATLCTGAFATASCVDTPHAQPSVRPAGRIVSLVPSATEVLLALGAADRIVGRTDFDTDPRIASVESFGNNMRAGAEAILAHRPHLVIDASYARWTAPAVMSQHIRPATLTTDIQSFADILSLIDTLGTLIGAPGRAASLRAELTAGAIQLHRTAPAIRPTVLYLVWVDPPRTISATSYLNEVIELAGARNAFADLRAPWPEISMEVILQRNPDYIIVTSDIPEAGFRLRAMAGWKSLGAVQANRIIEAPADLFHRPGPRVLDAAWWLREELHRTGGEG